MPLTLEVGREPRTHTCPDCGRTATSTQGFIYRDGDAFAIYFATLYDRDHTQRASLAIGIGTWDDDDSTADVSAFLDVWATEDEFRYGFVEASESPWGGSRLLTGQLSPGDARSHDRRGELLQVAEVVTQDDPVIADHLDRE